MYSEILQMLTLQSVFLLSRCPYRKHGEREEGRRRGREGETEREIPERKAGIILDLGNILNQ